MNILLFGASGQLGQDILLTTTNSDTIVPVTHQECEIGDLDSVRKFFDLHRADSVINSAAWTDVPGCESDDRRAFHSNALGAKYLAIAAAEFDIPILYVSTDYVFDGNKTTPYVESDLPGPLNSYGLTKLMGEYYTAFNAPKSFVVRTSGVYGTHECRGKKTNFVETMLRLSKDRDTVKVVHDETLAPTYSMDLAAQILTILKTADYGLYHAASHEQCTWFEFAEEIFRLANVRIRLEKTTVKEFGSPVRRPAYSVLANARLQASGLDRMRSWKEGLSDYLKKRKT